MPQAPLPGTAPLWRRIDCEGESVDDWGVGSSGDNKGSESYPTVI